MKIVFLFLATLAALPAWSANPASNDNVLYVHLMDDGEVVHTVIVREPAYLKDPSRTLVTVRGATLKTALIPEAVPYRLKAHLPSGLCAGDYRIQLTAAGSASSSEVAANLYALDACQGNRREPPKTEASLRQ